MIVALDNSVKGCFLLGCGPSLNYVELQRLAEYDTITFNRAYIAWGEWGFVPSYYACFDPIALVDNLAEIKQLIERSPVKRFFLNEVAAQFGLKQSDRVTLVKLLDKGQFSTNFRRLGDFGNVGASSLQVLGAMDYRRVVMVGIDARYTTVNPPGTNDQELIRVDHDQDHFSPEYMRGKIRMAKPDLDKLIGRWPEVAEQCKRYGMEVRNASPGSALKCFASMQLEIALSWIAKRSGKETSFGSSD